MYARSNRQAVAHRFGRIRRVAVDAPNAATGQDDGSGLYDDGIAAIVNPAIETVNSAVIVLDQVGDITIFDDFDIRTFFDGGNERTFDFGARAVAVGV